MPTQQSRTFLVQFRRQSQSLKENSPSKSPSADLQLTNLPYFIRRTPSNQLPVYLITKAGGTKQQTKLQKTEGDLDALRSDLAQFLGLESGDPNAPQSPDVTINRLTGHILVKGWRKPEIQQFLLQRNF
ncbi:54S ribosomal protein img2, mitochondrial [Aspergillus melleus]|uniref:54S ribosomal protein img2, mitochondrial n=1 Tax=Aspergillus melleus TaxID=138277 RepID=A0ACC3B594_9EURO|nr:54S ribosomal protein img2, mitochondrial [Aspergillus melleus]